MRHRGTVSQHPAFRQLIYSCILEKPLKRQSHLFCDRPSAHAGFWSIPDVQAILKQGIHITPPIQYFAFVLSLRSHRQVVCIDNIRPAEMALPGRKKS